MTLMLFVMLTGNDENRESWWSWQCADYRGDVVVCEPGKWRHLCKWLCEIHAKNKKLEDVKRVTMVFLMLMETIKK